MPQSQRFVDSVGFHWEVLEIDSGRASSGDASVEALGGGSLYFMSRHVTRVLREYPEQWALLDWAALEDLCAVASPLGGDQIGSSVRPSRSGSRREVAHR